MATKFDTVEEYLDALPDEVRESLQIMLDRARAVVPDAGLVLSYQMPTVTSGDRRIVHLAAWRTHLALYPVPDDEALQPELASYRSGAGTLRFPLREPIPYDLVDRVVAALYAQQG